MLTRLKFRWKSASLVPRNLTSRNGQLGACGRLLAKNSCAELKTSTRRPTDFTRRWRHNVSRRQGLPVAFPRLRHCLPNNLDRGREDSLQFRESSRRRKKSLRGFGPRQEGESLRHNERRGRLPQRYRVQTNRGGRGEDSLQLWGSTQRWNNS
jgi:hypothetical protein